MIIPSLRSLLILMFSILERVLGSVYFLGLWSFFVCMFLVLTFAGWGMFSRVFTLTLNHIVSILHMPSTM